MKILITGEKGQLGSRLLEILKSGSCDIAALPNEYIGCEVIGIDIDELDLTDKKAVEKYLIVCRPDVVINCAGYTNVDACEDNVELAFLVNETATGYLAAACEMVDAKFVHISTDYVFSGAGSQPLAEDTPTVPQSVYGKSKLGGELLARKNCSKAFVVRTAWLYGLNGGNFVKTILKLAKSRPEIKVVNDQFGSPTNVEDLAYHILLLAVTDMYSIYHVTNNGICTWYDFASLIVVEYGLDCIVHPCTSEEFPRPAKRPAWSVLSHENLKDSVGDYTRSWQDAIKVYIAQLKHMENN